MNASIVARTLRTRGSGCGCHAHACVGMSCVRQLSQHAHGKRGHGTRAMSLMLGAALLLGCSRSEPAAQPAAAPQPAVNVPPPPPPPPPKKAEMGVGKKGRGYGRGVVATPIASLFAVRERLAFDIQIPEAMKLFKANEDRAPKSHEEFMERIVKENHITLPLLPEGDRYQYDPKTEQLMVEQPAPE
jgi:hypothetical protein